MLAYAMLIYSFASLYYIINTRSIGTPFKNSLTPKQIKIKKTSSNIRRNIFRNGIMIALIFIILMRPFKSC